jgi:hypothetical protein
MHGYAMGAVCILLLLASAVYCIRCYSLTRRIMRLDVYYTRYRRVQGIRFGAFGTPAVDTICGAEVSTAQVMFDVVQVRRLENSFRL